MLVSVNHVSRSVRPKKYFVCLTLPVNRLNATAM